MANAPKEIRLSECEIFIKQIRDVISANIVAGGNNEIEEIHVLAEDTRNAKQIVRDIETLFRVEYNLDLDHKKISVVQLNKSQKNLQASRLKFSGIQLSLQTNLLEARVDLCYNQKVCHGQASGINSKTNSLRLIAEATMQALGSFIHKNCSIILDDVVRVSIGGRQLIVTTITLIQGSLEEVLIGSALVKQDEKEAAVRATLSALNRRLPVEF